ncbi:MAG: putative secreted hydrolase [Paraglaciecola sp.]|jgi:predicted secreted hydrolase
MVKLTTLKLATVSTISTLLVLFLSACSDPVVTPSSQPTFFSNPGGEIHGQPASPDYEITFPADHLAHPQFTIEWWYLTANLTDELGAPYAYQWTLFRFKSADKANSWDDGQSYMAHVSLHSQDQHWFGERFARGGVGNAGVTDKPLTLFLDDWQWQAQEGQKGLFPATVTSSIPNIQFTQPTQQAQLNLHLSTYGPFVLHGQNGFSVKSLNPPLASHYYSQPFIQIQGTLQIDGRKHQLKGTGWFDHEWSSQLMDAGAAGWDWFSLHLDNGAKIMAFRMRLTAQADFISGSYIEPDGSNTSLSAEELTLEPLGKSKVAGHLYPLTWHLKLPEKNIDLTLQASKVDQLNPGRFSYYEGALEISGSHTGTGFMELTGY